MKKTIIFASDLDQTLIYSQKHISHEILSKNEIDTLINVENNSFLTKKSYCNLVQISNEINFIPVTTRSKELFERLNFGKIKIKHAICSNGGMIFTNGVEDEVWKNKIARDVSNMQFNLNQMVSFLKKYKNGIFSNDIRIYDDLFICIKFSSKENMEIAKNILTNEMKEWEIEIAATKTYLMPKFISKNLALEYIKKSYFDNPFVLSAGDSEMDLKMIDMANFGIIPKHGISTENKNIVITNNIGILAGQEITDIVKEKIKRI